jgi:hypothetical protein
VRIECSTYGVFEVIVLESMACERVPLLIGNGRTKKFVFQPASASGKEIGTKFALGRYSGFTTFCLTVPELAPRKPPPAYLALMA